MGWVTEESRFDSLQGQEHFTFFKSVQIKFGAQRTSCSVGTGTIFHGVKEKGHEGDYSPPSSAEVKNVWRYISTPPLVFTVAVELITGIILYFTLQ
jgi:hypothetical protein